MIERTDKSIMVGVRFNQGKRFFICKKQVLVEAVAHGKDTTFIYI